MRNFINILAHAIYIFIYGYVAYIAYCGSLVDYGKVGLFDTLSMWGFIALTVLLGSALLSQKKKVYMGLVGGGHPAHLIHVLLPSLHCGEYSLSQAHTDF